MTRTSTYFWQSLLPSTSSTMGMQPIVYTTPSTPHFPQYGETSYSLHFTNQSFPHDATIIHWGMQKLLGNRREILAQLNPNTTQSSYRHERKSNKLSLSPSGDDHDPVSNDLYERALQIFQNPGLGTDKDIRELEDRITAGFRAGDDIGIYFHALSRMKLIHPDERMRQLAEAAIKRSAVEESPEEKLLSLAYLLNGTIDAETLSERLEELVNVNGPRNHLAMIEIIQLFLRAAVIDDRFHNNLERLLEHRHPVIRTLTLMECLTMSEQNGRSKDMVMSELWDIEKENIVRDLEDPDSSISNMCLATLGFFASQVSEAMEMLQHEIQHPRSESARRMAVTQLEIIRHQPLTQIPTAPDSPAHIESPAADTTIEGLDERANQLWKNPSLATQEDVAMLTDAIKRRAIRGENFGPLCLPVLFISMNHPDPEVQKAAKDALGHWSENDAQILETLINHPTTVPVEPLWDGLAESLASEKTNYFSVRYAVAGLLGVARTQDGEEIAIRLATHPDLLVRTNMVELTLMFLGPQGLERLWPYQRELFTTDLLAIDFETIKNVLIALTLYAGMGNKEAQKFIDNLSHHSNPQVREMLSPLKSRSGLSIQKTSSHIGRNDPCPCGSGKKYKKCCM